MRACTSKRCVCSDASCHGRFDTIVRAIRTSVTRERTRVLSALVSDESTRVPFDDAHHLSPREISHFSIRITDSVIQISSLSPFSFLDRKSNLRYDNRFHGFLLSVESLTPIFHLPPPSPVSPKPFLHTLEIFFFATHLSRRTAANKRGKCSPVRFSRVQHGQ